MSEIPEHEKLVVFKYTEGYVRQDFVDGVCVGQKFTAGDVVEWLDVEGKPVDPPEAHQYEPFDMVPPGFLLELGKRIESLAKKRGIEYGPFQKLMEELRKETEDVRCSPP